MPLGLWFWMSEKVMSGVLLVFLKLASAEPVVEPTRLFQMRQFFRVTLGELRLFKPPLLFKAKLPEMVQLIREGELERLCIPPPVPAKLPENKQLVNIGELELFIIPPPEANVPAEFPAKIQFVRVGVELALLMPPPVEALVLFRNEQLVMFGEADVETAAPAPVEVAELPEMMQFETVIEVATSLSPPPELNTML